MQTHKQVWESVLDVILLDRALNLAAPPKPLKEMDESTFNSWLSSLDFEPDKQPKSVPPISSVLCLREHIKPTETLILPMSLENNSTIQGTASILEEFGKEFNLPCEHKTEILELNKKTHMFDLKGARTHEFLKIMHIHREEMAVLEERMLDTTKHLEHTTTEYEESDTEEETGDADERSTKVDSSAAYIKAKYFD